MFEKTSKFPFSLFLNLHRRMNMQPPKRKVPIKSNYQFLIRAKMYGVITLNSLEGMMRELDELIPVDMERGMPRFIDVNLR